MATVTSAVRRPAKAAWLSVLATLSVLSFALSVVLIFLYAPRDVQQGEVQRLFYLHLPTAWLAYLSFFIIFVSSILYLLRGQARWDRLARSAAELGFIFTTLVLLTGSIWGRPIWGTWWTWDARLTTTLILWFIYLGYFLLRAYVADPERGARYAAVLGIVGFVDIPIIHMSVRWWRTMHPEPIVVRSEGPAMPPEMFTTVAIALIAFVILYAFLLAVKYWIETTRDEVMEIRGALEQHG